MNIFNYFDYRCYINDYIEASKKRNPSLSLRSFAKKVSLSPSYISMIILRKKKLSKKNALLLSREFQFKHNEEIFFIALIEFNDCPDPKQKIYLEKRLRKMKAEETLKKVDISSYQGLSWKHLFIMVAIESFSNKKLLIEKSKNFLELIDSEIKLILNELEKLSLIEIKENELRRTERNIIFKSEKDEDTLKDIHQNFLKKNIDLIENHNTEKRFSVSEFTYINPNQFQKLKEITNQYLDEISQLHSEEERKDILTICLHLNHLS